MDIYHLHSGLKNRINELKGTSPFFLFQLILIFLTNLLFYVFLFLKVKLILVNYPCSYFLIKVSENRDFWNMFIKGHWEKNQFVVLKQTVKKGDITIDVGAWNGVYTLFLSKLVGKEGKVYSFEPDPIVMRILKTNIKFNKIKNTKLENLAVSNSEGKEIFYILDEGGTSKSYVKNAPDSNRFGIITKELLRNITTLDNYCLKNNIIPNGIKIDVEGLEGLVIKGARRIMEQYKPWILLEFHGRFMSHEERIANWQIITERAKKVIFLGGIKQYRFGENITSKKEFLKDDNTVINVLIFY